MTDSGPQAPGLCMDEPVAADLMSTSVLAVEATETVGMVVELIARAGVHHVPVLRGGRCVGVLDDRALLAGRLRVMITGGPATVGGIPGLNNAHIDPHAPLSAVAARMVERHTDALLVRDRDGEVVGLITAHDVVRALARRPPRREPAPGWSQTPALFTLRPVLPAPRG